MVQNGWRGTDYPGLIPIPIGRKTFRRHLHPCTDQRSCARDFHDCHRQNRKERHNSSGSGWPPRYSFNTLREERNRSDQAVPLFLCPKKMHESH
nr:MAG TPA: hypothetical protein [Caudoviricetes sp.]